jgi:catechol 2,3-dioxygenase-like lactoylglutathione lyase family enzyme
MSRVQLALNVSDVEAAIEFYSTLFGTGPNKVRPGYANFAIADPPLKLVLIESADAPGSLNHLGIEVDTPQDVARATAHLRTSGLPTAVEDEVSCCYALQDKVWTDGPDGEPWEIYTVLADAEMPAGQLRRTDPSDGSVCCTPVTTASVTTVAAPGHDTAVAPPPSCC